MAGYGNREGGSPAGRKQNKYRRPRRKVCGFCVDKTTYIDFKNATKLKRYTSERGKIEPRRIWTALKTRILSSAAPDKGHGQAGAIQDSRLKIEDSRFRRLRSLYL